MIPYTLPERELSALLCDEEKKVFLSWISTLPTREVMIYSGQIEYLVSDIGYFIDMYRYGGAYY